MKENNKSNHLLWNLFFTFFKIGLFTFGGGYAMIPIMQKEVSEKNKWINDDTIMDIVAISQSTPGPIALNMATFVGYKIAKIKGAFLATFGVVLPSFSIIVIISYILEAFNESRIVKYAFFGIRAGVLALLLSALYKMYQKSPKGLFSYFIMAFAFVMVSFTKVNIIFVIIATGVFGFVYSYISNKRKKEVE